MPSGLYVEVSRKDGCDKEKGKGRGAILADFRRGVPESVRRERSKGGKKGEKRNAGGHLHISASSYRPPRTDKKIVPPTTT